ncbi:MAG: hypothetical protein R3244_08100, partial [Thermoanaerobaculia bacterium]|nr:hypothetical protein [Thermoanaerobaculia bacterium]
LVGERVWPAAALLVAGLALFLWTASEARPTAVTPAPTSLLYAFDSDDRQAFWVSHDETVNEWTAQVLPASARPEPPPAFLSTPADARRLVAAAPLVDLEPPRAELVGDVFDRNVRHLSVRVDSPRGAPFLLVAPDASLATLRAIGLHGRLVEVDPAEGPVVLVIENLPADGVVITLQTFDRQPVDLSVTDWSFGLPQFEQTPVEPRPPHLVRSTRWVSDSLLVHASYWF